MRSLQVPSSIKPPGLSKASMPSVPTMATVSPIPVVPAKASISVKPKEEPKQQIQPLLSPEDEEKFIAAFKLLDTDEDGEINDYELEGLMTKLGYKPHADDISEMISLAD